MDPTPLIDAAIEIVQSNPKASGLLALVPVTQMIAGLLARLPPIKRKHTTKLTRALTWWSRWPGPKGS